MKVLFLLLGIMLLQSCGFEIVDDGFVGVKRTMGKIESTEYPPGIHFYNPLTTGIFEMEIREKSLTNKVTAYSSDNQIVEAIFKINYRPEPSKMAELYTNQGKDYINVLLPQRVESSIKDVLGKYKATNLVQVRSKVTEEVKELIASRLEGTNVYLVSFEIPNFDYDDDFEKAVKRKVIAKEQAIEEQNRTVQIKEQAQQKLLQAEADAKAIKVRAEALAQNKDLIQLEAVKRWDGKLPQFTTGGAIPFINLNAQK